MRLFRKLQKVDGWRAVGLQGGTVCAVHVRRPPAAKPQVALALAYSADGQAGAPVLERLAREWQDQRYDCSTILAGDEYRFLPLEAPKVPSTELKQAVTWLVRDMIDFHVDEATIDVLRVPMEKNAPQRAGAMYAVAARSRLIEERQQHFESLKMPLKVIDVPEMAQRNIAGLYETENRAIALLSFDAQAGGLLTISAGGELYFARRIDVSLRQLEEFDQHSRATFHDRIALEIQRSLDHFGRQFPSIVLARLLVVHLGDGGSLRAFLADNLDTEVDTLDLGAVLDLSAVPELRRPDRQLPFFFTIGAALRVEEKVL